MAKLTDIRVGILQDFFDAGDQPTEAQFDQLILWIQEGIEEHDHDGTGDGDGILFDTLKILHTAAAAADAPAKEEKKEEPKNEEAAMEGLSSLFG